MNFNANSTSSFWHTFDTQIVSFTQSPDAVQEKIWSIGGDNGWLFMNWAWKIRGFIDK
jgi:hypothetical protein